MCKNSKFRMRTFAYACSLIAASLIICGYFFGIFLDTQNAYPQSRNGTHGVHGFFSCLPNGKVFIVIRNTGAVLLGEDRLLITSLFATTGSGTAGFGNAAAFCGDPIPPTGLEGAGVSFGSTIVPLANARRSSPLTMTNVNTTPVFDDSLDGGNGGVWLDLNNNTVQDVGEVFTWTGAGGTTALTPIGLIAPIGAIFDISGINPIFSHTYGFGPVVGVPTLSSFGCATPPADGISLPIGTVIIFAFDAENALGIDTGFWGLDIDDTGDAFINDGTLPNVLGASRIGLSIFGDCPTTTTTTTTTTSTTTTTRICQCPEDSPLGCISGRVIYIPAQLVHPGMTVRLRRLSPRPRIKMEVRTDSNGCYRFPDLEDGRYRIRVDDCKRRTRANVIVIRNGGKVNKDLGWWHTPNLRRCFFQ